MCPRATAIGGAAAAYVLLARPRHLRWGATDQESDEPLAGDDLIANADLTATRAIIIRALADQVWPWIAQLGQGRSGFYSYGHHESRTRGRVRVIGDPPRPGALNYRFPDRARTSALAAFECAERGVLWPPLVA